MNTISALVVEKRLDDLKKALSDGADPNDYSYAYLPLHYAICTCDDIRFECARLLVQYGALLNNADDAGYTTFDYVVLNNNKRGAWLLFDNGADIGRGGAGRMDWVKAMFAHRVQFLRECYHLLSIGSRSPLVCKDVIGLVARHLFSMRKFE